MSTHLRDWVLPSLKILVSGKNPTSKNPASKPLPIFWKIIYGREAQIVVPITLKPFSGGLHLRSDRYVYPEVEVVHGYLKDLRYTEDRIDNLVLDGTGVSNTRWHRRRENPIKRMLLSSSGAHSFSQVGRLVKFSQGEIALTMVKNSIKDLKKRVKRTPGSKVLFLGRDVWPFFVVGRRMGLPCAYDNRVSRMVAENSTIFGGILNSLGVNQGDIIFDTGFAGTIFRYSVEALDYKFHLENIMFSSKFNGNQQFRNMGLARNIALALEYLPKYTTPGKVERGKVLQHYHSEEEFIRTFTQTCHWWYGESPRWIPGKSLVSKSYRRKAFFW